MTNAQLSTGRDGRVGASPRTHSVVLGVAERGFEAVPVAEIARETRRQGERAFATLERGLAAYGPKARASANGQAKPPSQG